MQDNETFDPSELDAILATPVTAIVQDQPRDIRSTVEMAIMSIDADTPLDDVKEAIVVFNAIADWFKDQREKLNGRLIPVLEEHGSFTIGPFLYVLGMTEPKIKCTDVLRTMQELLKSAEVPNADGEAVIDWSVIAGCLSVNAFKPSTTRKQLPKLADELFQLPPSKKKVVCTGPKEEKATVDGPRVKCINMDFVK